MAHIEFLQTAIRDGWHNAFTDLVFWNDCLWMSYRKGRGHVGEDASIFLANSMYGDVWREAASLRAPGDCREGRFVSMPDGRLAMLFPSWVGGFAKKQLRQYVTFSEDGVNWSPLRTIEEPHFWFWSVKYHAGRYYSAAYSCRDAATDEIRYRLGFFISDDLLHWEKLADIAPECPISEANFVFQPDGEVFLFARDAARPSRAVSYFFRSRPPYHDWSVQVLGLLLNCPEPFEHNGKIYLAARRSAALENDKPRTPFEVDDDEAGLGLWRLEHDQNETQLQLELKLPAAGDCAYPGITYDRTGRLCLSYYSQHAYRHGCLRAPMPDAADVYFAVVNLTENAA